MPAFKKNRLFLALTVTVFLAGCAVGPDYARPTSTLPEQHKEATATAQAVAPVNAEWWKLFNDATLNQLVEQTLAANQDLQAALARLEAGEAAAREAGAELYPSIGLAANGSRNRISGETFSGQNSGSATYNNRRTALSLSYEVDLWGRVRRSNEAAGAEVLASRFGRDSVRLTLTGQVANEYLVLRSHDAEIAVSQDTVASRERTLRIVAARLDAGSTSALELAQAENSLAAARSQLSQLKRLRALSESQLALLTGQPGLHLLPVGRCLPALAAEEKGEAHVQARPSSSARNRGWPSVCSCSTIANSAEVSGTTVLTNRTVSAGVKPPSRKRRTGTCRCNSARVSDSGCCRTTSESR